MGFELKIRAKRRIRGGYLRTAALLLTDRLTACLGVLLPCAAALVCLRLSPLLSVPSLCAVAVGCSVVCVAGLFVREYYRAYLYRRFSDEKDARPSPLAALRLLCAGLLLTVLKTGTAVIFFSPCALCVSLIFFLSQAGLLYRNGLFALLLATGVLFLLGALARYAADGCFACVRYGVATRGDIGVRRILTSVLRANSSQLGFIFFYRLSLLGWRLLSPVPFASVYTGPYLFFARFHLESYLFEKALSACREEADSYVRIYVGKGKSTGKA